MFYTSIAIPIQKGEWSVTEWDLSVISAWSCVWKCWYHDCTGLALTKGSWLYCKPDSCPTWERSLTLRWRTITKNNLGLSTQNDSLLSAHSHGTMILLPRNPKGREHMTGEYGASQHEHMTQRWRLYFKVGLCSMQGITIAPCKQGVLEKRDCAQPETLMNHGFIKGMSSEGASQDICYFSKVCHSWVL